MKYKLLFTLILIITALVLVFVLHSDKPLGTSVKIDKLLVEKSKRRMHAYSKGKLIKTYKISLGRNPKGDKKFEGDSKTPEGFYTIYNKNPHSTCYKNLGISYPNTNDIYDANKLGKKPGGNIKIHGLLNGYGWLGKIHLLMDWTAGCIGVTNAEMEELYNAVIIGAPIEIRP